ncbi:hypothetical protein PUN28_018434 [Cardiocondyla obscurior]|uniref:Uncharacterized protein n=1 Tax=Cardiocondyla obscurior TaxID=286306 RepID=A0AAW2EI01_9HYME
MRVIFTPWKNKKWWSTVSISVELLCHFSKSSKEVFAISCKTSNGNPKIITCSPCEIRTDFRMSFLVMNTESFESTTPSRIGGKISNDRSISIRRQRLATKCCPRGGDITNLKFNLNSNLLTANNIKNCNKKKNKNFTWPVDEIETELHNEFFRESVFDSIIVSRRTMISLESATPSRIRGNNRTTDRY